MQAKTVTVILTILSHDMKRIVLSTSTSCLDYMDIRHSVRSIHQHLLINNVDFLDGHNIDIKRLQNIITASPNTTMSTAPASEDEIRQLFAQLAEDNYDEVIIITHSQHLSKSFHIISQVRDDMAVIHPAMTVHVLDCQQINFTQALMTLDAQRLFIQNESINTIIDHLNALNQSHRCFFVVEDLTYLTRSGRLKTTASFFANLLDIKPMLEIQQDGKIEAIKKVRKIEKAIDSMIDYLGKEIKNKHAYPYLLDAGNHELVAYTAQRVKDKLGLNEVIVQPVTPVSVATHGPNTVGLGAFIHNIPMSIDLF